MSRRDRSFPAIERASERQPQEPPIGAAEPCAAPSDAGRFMIGRRSASRHRPSSGRGCPRRRAAATIRASDILDRRGAELGVDGPPKFVLSNLPASRSGAVAAQEHKLPATRLRQRLPACGDRRARSLPWSMRWRRAPLSSTAASADQLGPVPIVSRSRRGGSGKLIAGRPSDTESARQPGAVKNRVSEAVELCFRALDSVTGLPTSSSLGSFPPSAEAFRHFAPG
jgi:hypothetical protein